MIYPIPIYTREGKVISKEKSHIIWINPSHVSIVRKLSKETYEVRIDDEVILIWQETFDWLVKQ